MVAPHRSVEKLITKMNMPICDRNDHSKGFYTCMKFGCDDNTVIVLPTLTTVMIIRTINKITLGTTLLPREGWVQTNKSEIWL